MIHIDKNIYKYPNESKYLLIICIEDIKKFIKLINAYLAYSLFIKHQSSNIIHDIYYCENYIRTKLPNEFVDSVLNILLCIKDKLITYDIDIHIDICIYFKEIYKNCLFNKYIPFTNSYNILKKIDSITLFFSEILKVIYKNKFNIKIIVNKYQFTQYDSFIKNIINQCFLNKSKKVSYFSFI